jgi:cellulose synthase/poly-beta-1,6-N-acetylglucosamine synthase-like glycosyltransferase
LFLDEVLTSLLVAQVGLVLVNLATVRRPPSRRWSSDAPLVSVLVPVRNEAANIGPCLESLLAQDYPSLEIIVFDDDSTDGSAAIVRSLGDGRVRLMVGDAVPEGWTGKNWACHRLSERARGDVLCFVDADTILEADTVSRAAGELRDRRLGLMSMLLRSRTATVGEAVLMPMVNYAMLALMPARLVENPTYRHVAVALGPFIMVTRPAYAAAGGHAAAPDHLVDDVRLARAVKKSGHRIGLRNGTTLIHTRWYTGLREIWGGFSKNAYGALDYRPGVALTALIVVMPLLVLPFIRLGMDVSSGRDIAFPIIQVGLILATRTITSRVGRDPLWSVPLHPAMIVVWAGTLAHSMMLARPGREIEWKGRPYQTHPSVARRPARTAGG